MKWDVRNGFGTCRQFLFSDFIFLLLSASRIFLSSRTLDLSMQQPLDVWEQNRGISAKEICQQRRQSLKTNLLTEIVDILPLSYQDKVN